MVTFSPLHYAYASSFYSFVLRYLSFASAISHLEAFNGEQERERERGENKYKNSNNNVRYY